MTRQISGTLRAFLSRIIALFHRDKLDSDLDEELRSHVAHAIEEYLRKGMSRKEAQREALRSLGGLTQTKEQYRMQRGLPILETLTLDIRYALRQLRKSPGFTLTAILTLALGVGAVTAVFSVVQGVLLRPYPFHDPSQVVVVRETVRELETIAPLLPDNYLHYLNLRAHAQTITDAAIFQNDGFSVSATSSSHADDALAHPRETEGLVVASNFFSVLGVQPILGRTFTPEESQPGKDNEIILTWAAWQRYFHGNPNVLGQSLRIDGVPVAIVGVLPQSFRFPVVGMLPNQVTFGSTDRYEIFRPLVPSPSALDDDDGDYNFLVVARLKPGVNPLQAQTELDSLDKSYAAARHFSTHLGVAVEPFPEEITGSYRKPLWLLFVAVFAVLLMACVNLAGLQIARGVARYHETALRSALGAGKSRLLQGLLIENLILGVAGGICGILFALAAEKSFLVAAASLPRVNEIHLSAPMLALTLALSILTSVCFGILPALRSLRVTPQSALQINSSRFTGARDAARARRILVAVEVACSVTLLIVTALITRSFSHLLSQDRHFNSQHMMMAKAELSEPRYSSGKSHPADFGSDPGSLARDAMIVRTLDRLRSLPGVQSAAVTGVLLQGETGFDVLVRPDHPFPPGQEPLVNRRFTSPGFFAAMGIPILAGRDFSAADEHNRRVVILSENIAKTAFTGEDPLGRIITHWGRTYTVIGIAADARINTLKRDSAFLYWPYWEYPPNTLTFVVRAAAAAQNPGKSLGPAMRQAIWSVDPDITVPIVLSLDAQIAESVATDRFQALLLSSFGGAALLLAVLGIYGVLAYSVSLRTQEFGIRIALGSNRARLARLVLKDASYPLCGGILLGLLGAAAATRWIRSLLYETSAADPWAITLSLAVLLLAALLASLIPLRKAATVDPMQALRTE